MRCSAPAKIFHRLKASFTRLFFLLPSVGTVSARTAVTFIHFDLSLNTGISHSFLVLSCVGMDQIKWIVAMLIQLNGERVRFMGRERLK